MPSVRGLITFGYEKIDGQYTLTLNLPEDMQAVLYVPSGAVVRVNGAIYYEGGGYSNGAGNIEIVEK